MNAAELGEKIRTQDNLATAEPVFVVYDKHRVIGVGKNYTETFMWVDADGDECERNDLATRVGYVEVDRFRAAFFTREAADAFVARQRHNMRQPHVFVESGHHNSEWKTVRALLTSL